MRFGFHFMDFNLPGEPASLARAIAASARATEEAGGSWFTAMDHYFQMEVYRTAHDPMLEGYTVLGFAAAHTSRVKLGTLVTGITYRHPGVLSKIVTTLDVLSEGRAMLGVGAAWYDREHHALGVPYPAMAERFERLEETIQIALQIGGSGERKTLRMVAQYADICNLNVTEPEEVAALGIEHVQLRNRVPDPAGYIRAFGEKVAPRLADIQTA
jgi:alkanesulfonate monooxygenase SsuD/methylene tetrahydromethanopterin reductase-like flavin-dependent oxidoreductase (luciferase family)